MILDRLVREARAGDALAARSLLSEAERRGDPQLEAEARAALGDVEGLLDLAMRAWHQDDDALAQICARGLGFAFDGASREVLAALHAAAVGRRRSRILGRREMLSALAAARRAPDGWVVHAATREVRSGEQVMLALVVHDAASARLAVGLDWCTRRGLRDLRYTRWAFAGYGEGDARQDEALRLRWARSVEAVPGRTRDAVAVVAALPLEQRASTPEVALLPWLEALEQLLCCEPAGEVWQALVTLLAAWPGGVDRALAGEITARLDARWPDALRCYRLPALATNPRDARRIARHQEVAHSLTGSSAACAWPVARGLYVASSLASLPSGLPAEVFEAVRMVEVDDPAVGEVGAAVDAAAGLVCESSQLAGARGLGISERSPVLEPMLRHSPEWLGQLESLRLHLSDVGRSELAARLLESAPRVRSLELRSLRHRRLTPREVAAVGSLGALTSLVLADCEADLTLLLSSLAAAGARLSRLEVRVSNSRSFLEVYPQLARADGVESLEQLTVWGPQTKAGVALARLCERIERLRELTVCWTRFVVGGALEAMLRAAGLASLESLCLDHTALGPQEARALASMTPPAGLRRLSLRRCGIGGAGLLALSEAGWLEGLEVLDLTDCGLTGGPLASWLRSPRAPCGLRELWLGGNELGANGARALAEWPGGATLARLQVGNVGRAGVTALEHAPHLRAWLDGSSSGLRRPAWEALSCAPRR